MASQDLYGQCLGSSTLKGKVKLHCHPWWVVSYSYEKEIYYFYRTEEFVTWYGTVLSRFVRNIAEFLAVHNLIT